MWRLFLKIPPLSKISKFNLISWCGNFVEMHNFCRASGNLPETLQKLCISTKFPHQEIRIEIVVFYAVLYFVTHTWEDWIHSEKHCGYGYFRISHQMCSMKKIFLKILQKSKENICFGDSFWIKFQVSGKTTKVQLQVMNIYQRLKLYLKTLLGRYFPDKG